MITNATPEMLPRMNALWNCIFGDSLEYSSFFFKSNLKGENEYTNQFVYLAGGKPVSMLTVLEGKLNLSGKMKKFWYVYAVLTDQEYRKKGYAGQVLSHVLKLAESQDILVGLVPASESLYQYYEKMGFRTFFYKKVKKIVLDVPEHFIQEEEIHLEEATVTQYEELRNKAFAGNPFIVWDSHAVTYALQENKNLGGKAFAWQGTPYFMLVCPVGEELVIRETNLPEYLLQKVCNKLGQQFPSRTAMVSMPPFVASDQELIHHGMICGNVSEEAVSYIGLALD